MGTTTARRRPGLPRPDADRRLAARLLAAVLAFALAAVPCAVLLVLVEARWAPLARLDQDAALTLHRVVLAHPGRLRAARMASDYLWDPWTMRFLVAITVGWLLARRAWRLALWAALTVTAAGVVGLLAKLAVARARPHLADPVAHAGGYSFPSGHAMTAAVSCAVLLLVLLPVVPLALRPVAWLLAGCSVVGVGFSRVALGVHWVSDVLGGWLLGLALVGATAWAFDVWRAESGLVVPRLTEGLEPELAGQEAPEPVLAAGGGG
ncbi:phosphatase PAP2 family protein [Kitasatospora sp. NPDC057015]|uniref:phosphatase PAP2 family protein n=1 Tax=Kitasatospora sp. NPDC057015 TaxID=3346001 RepID=UPI00364454E7